MLKPCCELMLWHSIPLRQSSIDTFPASKGAFLTHLKIRYNKKAVHRELPFIILFPVLNF